ncbi:MAG: type II toxin-antitoxin system VapC family toxin [Verrucomicrobiota bacterium]
MILPDVNLLLYAHNRAGAQHEAAKGWWEAQLNSMQPVALCWVAIYGFIRISTHPRIFEKPLKAKKAAAYVREWLEQSNVILVEPGLSFSEIYLGYVEQLGAGGNLTTDAYLAALAVEHQAELQSTDEDFGRFSGLRWSNPLR